MINPAKHDRALDAIHMVLVYARMVAASGAQQAELVEVLDVAEYLPTLFLRQDDQTTHFRELLVENAKKFSGFQAALERFDREV